eukprot:4600490-Amphidinium_carterae.1
MIVGQLTPCKLIISSAQGKLLQSCVFCCVKLLNSKQSVSELVKNLRNIEQHVVFIHIIPRVVCAWFAVRHGLPSYPGGFAKFCVLLCLSWQQQSRTKGLSWKLVMRGGNGLARKNQAPIPVPVKIPRCWPLAI